MKFRLVIAIFSVCMTLSLFGQDVVFSRRVYKEQGQSYQQIWSWNPTDDVLKDLTHSARDHHHPACKDGTIIFVSENARLWSFNSASGEERIIGSPPPPPNDEPKPRNGYDVFAKAGNLEACGKGEDLSVLRDNKAIGHFKTDEALSTNTGRLVSARHRSSRWTGPRREVAVGGRVGGSSRVGLLRHQSRHHEAHQDCHCLPEQRSLAARKRWTSIRGAGKCRATA